MQTPFGTPAVPVSSPRDSFSPCSSVWPRVVLGLSPGFTSTFFRNPWVQNLPSAVTLGQSRPSHPALRGSLEDPEGSKGNNLSGEKRSPEEALEMAVIAAMGVGGHV